LASDAVDDAMPHSICLRFARYTSRSFLNMAKHHLRSAIGRFMCASVSGVLASAILIISPIILRRGNSWAEKYFSLKVLCAIIDRIAPVGGLWRLVSRPRSAQTSDRLPDSVNRTRGG